MNPCFFLSVGIIVSVLGISGISLAAEDWKYSESGEVDEGAVDGPPGSMVTIPEGEFIMGDNDGSRNERPEHTVWLNAYSIDRYEVTMAEYQTILDHDYSIEPPPLWDDGVASGKNGNRPAIGITWTAATRYCAWVGKRLPTEAEWEKAARGTDGRRYPWGHMQPFVDIANYNQGTTGWVSYLLTLYPVTSGTKGMSVRHGLTEGGKSAYGLYHMAGNAAEWVNDWYDRYYYEDGPKKNPQGPAEGDFKVLRGGSWEDQPVNLRVMARSKAEVDFQDLTTGFRCAKDESKD
jgi:formylglycine-generating enzyme required for sulfatase activity